MYYSKPKKAALAAADRALNGLIGAIAGSLPDGARFCASWDAPQRLRYTGRTQYRRGPGRGNAWLLGYASESLVPQDVLTRPHYLGGYYMPEDGFCNLVEEVVDDMRVRCVAIGDNPDGDAVIFATVDCIGISNDNVCLIRERFEEKRRAACPDKAVCSANVLSTHTHSCIDTQGLWTGGVKRILKAFGDVRKGRPHQKGMDDAYRAFLIERVSDVMLAALLDMRRGKLTYCVKDLGEGYFENRNRPSATALDTRVTRLVFTPDEKDVRPTLIALTNAHPDVAGMPTGDGSGTGRALSGDYVYYCGELIEQAGYNFMFMNGAIAAIYMSRGLTNDGQPMEHRYEQSVRYGRELARMLLAMDKTRRQIESDALLSDRDNVERERALAYRPEEYTLWYEGWEPVKTYTLRPFINIRQRSVQVRVTNPIILLAGKLDLTDVTVVHTPDGFFVTTEVGYFELGERLRAAMVPGEFCQDLVQGGRSLRPEGSYSGLAFSYPTVRDIFGPDVIAVGLANDEAGYIVPDNDYVLSDFKGHYQEELSLGHHTASTIMKALQSLRPGS